VVQIADNLPLEKMSAAELEAVRAHASDLGIAIEVGTRGIYPDHLRRMLEICALFGSPILRIVVDTAAHEPSVDEIVTTLVQLQPEFAEAKVVPALENHDRFNTQTFVQIMKRLGRDKAGICLDTVNSFGALEGPELVIDTLAPWTINLHLKDFVIRRHPSAMGFEIVGAPAGTGRLNIPGLLARLKRTPRECNAILEQWPPPAETIKATVQMERDWAVKSIQYLRTLIPG